MKIAAALTRLRIRRSAACIGFMGIALLAAVPLQAADLPDATLDLYFSDPPNEYRIFEYQLKTAALAEYPQYGFGGYMPFFYLNLYQNKNGGVTQMGPLVDAANAQGRDVWLADDFGYPSGSAGGQVVADNPEYEVRGVAMLSTTGSGQVPVSLSTPPDTERMVSAVLYPLVGGVPDFSQGQVQTVQDSGVNTTGLDGPWTLCAFVLQIRDSNTQAQTTTNQFGSTGHYPDLLNPAAVQSFLAQMHQPIVAQIEDLASTVEGFYYNEPSLMQLNWDTTAPYACLSWNAALFDTFQAMHAYSLMPVMGALYGGDDLFAKRVRLHFHQTVAELLRTSFTGKIAEWCAQRGIVSSGHPLIEESLPMHVANYGDMMKVEAESQVPALDIGLPEPDRMATFNYHVAKLMSSIAAWKERDSRVLCLLDPIIAGYGTTRLSPSEAVLCNSVNMATRCGVNLFSTYIPLDGYASPEIFQRVNEYAGRIAVMLRGARIETAVALYYPIEMFQMEYKPTTATHWSRWGGARQVAWDGLQTTLLGAGIDYNIMHPEGLRDADIANGELKIGSGSYRYLVMPRMEMISLAALNKIQQFEAAGGTVLWVDTKPVMGAYPSEDAQVVSAVGGYATVSAGQVPGLIAGPYHDPFGLTVTPGTAQVYTTRFNRQGRCLYYLVNRTGSPVTAHIQDDQPAGAKVYEPSTGAITEMALPADVVIQGYRSVLVSPTPPSFALTVTAPTNGQAFFTGSPVVATATVANGTSPYTVTFYTNSVMAWTTNTSTYVSYVLNLGTPAVGTYTLSATVTDSATPTPATASSTTNTFTVEDIPPVRSVTVGNGSFETPGAYASGVTYWAHVGAPWVAANTNSPYQQNKSNTGITSNSHFTDAADGYWYALLSNVGAIDDLISTGGWSWITPPEPDGWASSSDPTITIADLDAANRKQRFYRIEAKSVDAE